MNLNMAIDIYRNIVSFPMKHDKHTVDLSSSFSVNVYERPGKPSIL